MNFRQEEKLDKVVSDIVEIKITMAENTASLKEHMRRTEILEAEIKRRTEGLETDMKPLAKHVAMVNGAFKLAGALATAIGAVYGLLKIFRVID